jgi:hypothetical protein
MKTKTESLEINLEEYDKELLVELILYAHKNNFTINEAIATLLKNFLDSEKQYE